MMKRIVTWPNGSVRTSTRSSPPTTTSCVRRPRGHVPERVEKLAQCQHLLPFDAVSRLNRIDIEPRVAVERFDPARCLKIISENLRTRKFVARHRVVARRRKRDRSSVTRFEVGKDDEPGTARPISCVESRPRVEPTARPDRRTLGAESVAFTRRRAVQFEELLEAGTRTEQSSTEAQ